MLLLYNKLQSVTIISKIFQHFDRYSSLNCLIPFPRKLYLERIYCQTMQISIRRHGLKLFLHFSTSKVKIILIGSKFYLIVKLPNCQMITFPIFTFLCSIFCIRKFSTIYYLKIVLLLIPNRNYDSNANTNKPTLSFLFRPYKNL